MSLPARPARPVGSRSAAPTETAAVRKPKPGAGIRRQLREGALRGDVYAPDCPSRALLDHVTTRWGVLVLILLLDRPHRFAELAASVNGVSDKMLSQTLKVLAADGFVERVVDGGPPVRVEYRLTDAGSQVATRVADLVEWLEENVGVIEAGKARPAATARRGKLSA